MPRFTDYTEHQLDRVQNSIFDRDAMIVRMYESSGAGAEAAVSFRRPVARVSEVDLMGNTISDLRVREDRLELQFGAFKIRTIEVDFA